MTINPPPGTIGLGMSMVAGILAVGFVGRFGVVKGAHLAA